MEPELSADHSRKHMLPFTWMLAALAAAAASHAPVVVTAALRAGPGCFSTVLVEIPSGRRPAAEIQARLETSELVTLAAAARSTPSPIPLAEEIFDFAPHRRRSFRPGGRQEAGDAWVVVWETDPSETLPALVVEGYVECIIGDQLRTAPRSAALAMRNPWFAGDVADSAGAIMAVVNASAQAALAGLCSSAGNWHFVPAEMPDGRLARLCAWPEQVAIPPFGSRTFPVAREGALHARGNSFVLLLLRPVAEGVREYRVDPSIHFGGEVPPPHPGH